MLFIVVHKSLFRSVSFCFFHKMSFTFVNLCTHWKKKTHKRHTNASTTIIYFIISCLSVDPGAGSGGRQGDAAPGLNQHHRQASRNCSTGSQSEHSSRPLGPTPGVQSHGRSLRGSCDHPIPAQWPRLCRYVTVRRYSLVFTNILCSLSVYLSNSYFHAVWEFCFLHDLLKYFRTLTIVYAKLPFHRIWEIPAPSFLKGFVFNFPWTSRPATISRMVLGNTSSHLLTISSATPC